MSEEPLGCGRPSGGPVSKGSKRRKPDAGAAPADDNPVLQARVGQKAPDFEAPAYVDGGFKKVKLSDYLGKWTVLCFYPGDFTFV